MANIGDPWLEPIPRIPAVATPTDVQRKTLRHLAKCLGEAILTGYQPRKSQWLIDYCHYNLVGKKIEPWRLEGILMNLGMLRNVGTKGGFHSKQIATTVNRGFFAQESNMESTSQTYHERPYNQWMRAYDMTVECLKKGYQPTVIGSPLNCCFPGDPSWLKRLDWSWLST